jgi:hypothetical protein
MYRTVAVLDDDPSFRPVRRRDGYLALEDMGLIGDGTTSALVGLDGSVVWLCAPRSTPRRCSAALLDHARGGHFTVAPDEVIEARQRYEPDTAVLVTELRTPTGTLAVTACPWRHGAGPTSTCTSAATGRSSRCAASTSSRPTSASVWCSPGTARTDTTGSTRRSCSPRPPLVAPLDGGLPLRGARGRAGPPGGAHAQVVRSLEQRGADRCADLVAAGASPAEARPLGS